jgi:hypothetical protein
MGCASGEGGGHLLDGPRLTITRSQIDELVPIRDDSLAAVAADLAKLRY